ncbi:hypothetical protein HELRODRAFT_179528 [Helobdella robusta]|uniref:Uncharacterized protein n=1 Tax=Helobdella robusta TaxID=6412 RepID=T1FEU7_HELRO|nr:hypothetical protein HELRODRAFT_179528 [Helobdella robusta]ESN95201.1 hypothetical protein HELRODRAFT_179528 [Helobdella robusta]
MFIRSVFYLTLSNVVLSSSKSYDDALSGNIFEPSVIPISPSSSIYTKIPVSPSSTCYPDASETTQYSVRSVQRCAAYCSVLPTCRRFNYYYQSNVYGTAGDCRLFPSSNCHHVPQINGFLAYVNNVVMRGDECHLYNPCLVAGSHPINSPANMFPHIDPAYFIQCSNGICHVKPCPSDTHFDISLKICTRK